MEGKGPVQDGIGSSEDRDVTSLLLGTTRPAFGQSKASCEGASDVRAIYGNRALC